MQIQLAVRITRACPCSGCMRCDRKQHTSEDILVSYPSIQKHKTNRSRDTTAFTRSVLAGLAPDKAVGVLRNVRVPSHDPALLSFSALVTYSCNYGRGLGLARLGTMR